LEMKKIDMTKMIVIATFWIVLVLLVWIKPSDEFSDAERRRLQQFPEVSWERIASNKFMTEFETYALDQFPFRDWFRGLTAYSKMFVLGQQDNNGIYMHKGYLSKLEYPRDDNSLKRATDRFRYIYDTYLLDADAKIYCVVIPDKNYYMAEQEGVLALDYDEFYYEIEKKMSYAHFIDIRDSLELEDYYRTDTHWRQECIIEVADEIATRMGAPVSGAYDIHTLEVPFYGVYRGQSAMTVNAETMYYLANERMEQYIVYDYESGKEIPLYDMEKAYGKDPYEMYMAGDLALAHIENPNADSDKELIVFRDSFGSSLAPLVAEGYRKTTLVDIRYIQPEVLGKYVDFEGKDVLFLYSTLVLNNSEIIK